MGSASDERSAPPAPDAAPSVTGQSAIRRFVGQRLGVLRRERDCRIFFTGYTASLTGSSMVPVALSFAVLKQGHGSGAVGAVLAAETVPLAALLLLGGVVADRLPRRAVMIASDLLRLASETCLAILLLTGRPPVLLIMALASILGIGQAFFNPALTGFVPQIASAENLQDANALSGLAKAAARVAGPGIAGVLIATVGSGAAVAVDAATAAISLVCLLLLRPRPAERARSEPMLRQLAAGWTGFRERTWLWTIVTQGGLAQLFTFAPFLVIGSTMFSHGSGSAAWGAILAADGVGGLLGAVYAMRLRPAHPLMPALIGSLGLGGTPALLAFRAPLWLLLAGSLVSGVGVALFLSLFDTVVQRNVPDALLSRVSAYNWLGTIALSPVGYALAGPAAHAAGSSAVLLFGSAFMVASTLILLAVPGVRHLPWRDE